MGKQGKGKSSGYVHNHTYNAKARESNERKLISIQNIAIRRFQSYVEKIQNNMKSYVPPGQHLKSKMGKYDRVIMVCSEPLVLCLSPYANTPTV